MKKPVLTAQAQESLKAIHALSLRYNQQEKKDHVKRLLELIRHHVDEIEDLYAKGDKHALVETGDLAVLCFELMIEHKISTDEIMNKCFERYFKKLNYLIKQ